MLCRCRSVGSVDFWENMEMITNYMIPVLLLVICLIALSKKEKAYDHLLDGAGEGLRLMLTLTPTLVLLLTAVTMLRESGAMDILTAITAPIFRFFRIPPELALLVLIRPISGSAALAVGTQIMGQYGVDSLIGRTAAVMLGSTETTFYAISVYFGAAGIHKTRYAIPAALLADFVGFFIAALTVRIWTN